MDIAPFCLSYLPAASAAAVAVTPPAEVPAHTERGHKLLEVQRLLREFAALRIEVLDRVAAERALRDLRRA